MRALRATLIGLGIGCGVVLVCLGADQFGGFGAFSGYGLRDFWLERNAVSPELREFRFRKLGDKYEDLQRLFAWASKLDRRPDNRGGRPLTNWMQFRYQKISQVL